MAEIRSFIKLTCRKFIITIAFITLSSFLFGQNTSYLEISLKNSPAISQLPPSVLDSIVVKININRGYRVKLFENIIRKDSVFKLSEVPIGKYILSIFSKGFLIPPLPVVICSKCKKNIDFVAIPFSNEGSNLLFDIVEIYPRYSGGEKALMKDFQSSLDKNQKQIINETSDFSIHFFITKEKEISDITFSPSNLSQEVKSILLKGVNSLTNWEVAIINGLKADGEYNLQKSIFTQFQ